MPGIAYIGVGSNMGDAFGNCRMGITRVTTHSNAQLLATSSFYRTSPVSPIPQDDFINAVIKIEWNGTPFTLLDHLHQIEQQMGRVRTVRLGPRTIDLDILLFNSVILCSSDLTIPHPRFHERKFALIPLLEIAPDLVHPLLKQPLSDLLREITDEQNVFVNCS
jgi:2-amino-4-hydroxy-6-hydroxymethyldihydropteridine diphosphokinase